MYPVLFKIGFFELRVYSLMYILGIVITIFFVSRRAEAFKIARQEMENIIIIGFIGAIIGSRAYYVLLNWPYFSNNFSEIPAIWHGGLAIHGGIAGGVAVILLYAYRKKLSAFTIGDLILPFLLLSQGIGRIGNFANGEVHGFPTITPFSIIFNLKKSMFGEFWQKVLSTYNVHNDPKSLTAFYDFFKSKGELTVNFHDKVYTLKEYVPWGISFPEKYMSPAYQEFGSIPLHPAFFYEAILNAVFAFVLIYFWKKDKYVGTGMISGMYFIAYGFIRAFATMFRSEDLMVGWIRAPHLASIVLVGVGVFLIYLSRKKLRA